MKYLGPQPLTLRYSKPGFKRRKVESSEDVLPILAIDPGGVTGWSLLVLKRKVVGGDTLDTNQEICLNNVNRWWHGQIDCKQDESYGCYQIKKILDDWPSAAVVMESFFIRQRAVDLSPIKIIAKLEDHLWNQGRKMFFQQASQAKTTCTDDRLKLWGVYTADGGWQHARDADRHALLFLRRCIGAQGFSLRQQAWPHIYSGVNA